MSGTKGYVRDKAGQEITGRFWGLREFDGFIIFDDGNGKQNWRLEDITGFGFRRRGQNYDFLTCNAIDGHEGRCGAYYKAVSGHVSLALDFDYLGFDSDATHDNTSEWSTGGSGKRWYRYFIIRPGYQTVKIETYGAGTVTKGWAEITSILQGCDWIVKAVENKQYQADSIVFLIEEMNKCLDGN